MRKLAKYLLLTSFYSLVVFFIYEVFHQSGIFKSGGTPNFLSLFIYVVLTLLFMILPLGMHNGDFLKDTKFEGAKLFMFCPSLGKKVYHASGIYYMEYSRKDDSYDLYYDRIFYRMPIKTISSYDINNNTGHDGNINLSQIVDNILNTKYKDLLKKQNEKKTRLQYLEQKDQLLKNWDGHTSIETKRDVLIDEIL